MIFSSEIISNQRHKLLTIMADLNGQSGVKTAVLFTKDGLPVNTDISQGIHLAALAAHQSIFMLGIERHKEIIIRSKNNLLVCHLFFIGNLQLILAVLIAKNQTYKRLLQQMSSSIQDILRGEAWQ